VGYLLVEVAEVVKIIMEVLAVQAVQVAEEPGANQIMAPLELLILEVAVEADQELAAVQPGLVEQAVAV